MITLHTLRRVRRCTQEQMHKRTGLQRTTVSTLENGSDYSYSTLAKHLDALGCKLELLVVMPDGAREPLKINRPHLCEYDRSSGLITLRAYKGGKTMSGFLVKDDHKVAFVVGGKVYTAHTANGILSQLRIELQGEYSKVAWAQAADEIKSVDKGQ